MNAWTQAQSSAGTYCTVLLGVLLHGSVFAAPCEISGFPAFASAFVVGDGVTPAVVQITVTDPDGHSDIRCVRVLFNYTESPRSQTWARGYLAWGRTDSDIVQYGGTWNLAAANQGRWGQMESAWGGTSFVLCTGCTVSSAGAPAGGSGSLTVAWTVVPRPAWANNPTVNDADAWAADSTTTVGWLDNPGEFQVLPTGCPSPPATPRAPVVSGSAQTTLDVAIHPEDSREDAYAIRVTPGMEGRIYVQEDGRLGFFPVFQTPTAWGTRRVIGLPWGRLWTVAARRLSREGSGCISDAGPGVSRSTAPSSVVARGDYGARFEPKDGVLHGAGQTYREGTPQNTAFERYADTLGDSRFPLVFMDYLGVGSPVSAYERVRARVERIENDYGKRVFPQIGFYIASGEALPTEAQLDLIVAGMRALGRPSFLRIGYEFNGTWYQPMYQPTYYVESFRRVTRRLREAGLLVATLWCAFPGYDLEYGSWEFLRDFYPGDEYVDWWSVDLFTPDSLLHGNTLVFLAQAQAHGKPVMIGEATPTGVGADGAEDWNTWFVPFFGLIHNHACLKGHAYIDWDWANTEWPTWGDARLETGNATVRANYLQEMGRSLYRHATGETPEFLRTNAAQIAID